MIRDGIGIIFGETGVHSFKFAVPFSGAARTGDYVKVWHDNDGWVLAQIVSMTRSSNISTHEDAMSLAAGNRSSEISERIVAKSIVIGSKDPQGILRTPRTPFTPGDRVFHADVELVQNTLGVGNGDVYIGNLDGTQVRVHLDVNKLVSNHCSILAKTGSGKSYTSGVIIEELLEIGVPLVIIDPHGEYKSLKNPNSDAEAINKMGSYGIAPCGYSDRITVYTPSNLSLNPNADKVFRLDGINISARLLRQLIPINLTSTQMGVLYAAVKKVRSKSDFYTLDDIIDEVKKDSSSAKWNVIDAIDMLMNTGMLSDSPTTIDEIMQQGRAAILDMQGVDPKLQDVIVYRLCDNLFEARKMGNVPPGMLVIEEAHEFCPEKGFEKTISSGIIRTIASEGRKFGLGLMIISQRPARIDKNVLSQCHTQIILKVTNSNDLKALSRSLEGVSPEMEDEIKNLPSGTALVVNDDIARPVVVDVRVRKTEHGGTSVKVVEDSSIREPFATKDGGILSRVLKKK